MTAAIVWNIEWMQCKPTEGQYTDVVITAGWRCGASQTADGKDYSAVAYSSVEFPQPTEGGQYTPYADLTEGQVLGWCWANGVNKTAVEAGLQISIDNLINPPIIQPPLPWATPAA